MGGILVVECKCWNVGGLLQVCGLWFVVCGRVPKFGYRISLPGELVLEFNYLKSFKFLNFQIRLDWFPPRLYHEMRSGRNKF
jgi:hypothetical protein